MAEIDPRIVTISIEINNQRKIYSSPFALTATGTKYGNALQNDCIATIENIDKSTRDFLLTETSPYNLNKTPKILTVEAGRESYGTSIIYIGNIVSVTASQPPDIKITFKCMTGNFVNGNVLTRFQPGQSTHKQICQQIAQDTNTILSYQATDKNIKNYSFSGGALDQVRVAGSLGNYNVFIDNDVLIVKDALIPIQGGTRILSAETGMIGIPEFTEHGLRVMFLIDNKTKLGSAIEIRSAQYPSTNGIYVIYKLGFQITNRDTPFYYVAEAARIPEGN